MKKIKVRQSKADQAVAVVLYTVSRDAQEWSEWSILLSKREERIYRRAIRRKAYLEDVLELSTVLDRAETEIMEHENIDYPPRLILKDPNYPVDAPNIRHEFIHVEHFREAARLLREYEEREKAVQKESER